MAKNIKQMNIAKRSADKASKNNRGAIHHRVVKEENDVQSKKNNSHEVQEPYTEYGGAMPVLNQLYSSSNGFWEGTLHIVPTADKITIIKKGISKRELESIKEQSDLDYETLSSILSVSKAKLHSKKGTEKFDQNTSERIMLLADVLAYGQSVFEDRYSFNEWLKTSNKALGNKQPVELMDTIYGIDEVKKEIGRIEYGVF